MNEDQWAETYKPVPNHINNTHGYSIDGCCVLFETYGPEFDYVREMAITQPGHVWTYMDDDNGNPCIGLGIHYVNRIGYFITKIPANGGPEEDCIQDSVRDEWSMVCPHCGSDAHILIQVTSWAELSIGGTDDLEEDNEWDDASLCMCSGCQHSSTVRTFRLAAERSQ